MEWRQEYFLALTSNSSKVPTDEASCQMRVRWFYLATKNEMNGNKLHMQSSALPNDNWVNLSSAAAPNPPHVARSDAALLKDEVFFLHPVAYFRSIKLETGRSEWERETQSKFKNLHNQVASNEAWSAIEWGWKKLWGTSGKLERRKLIKKCSQEVDALRRKRFNLSFNCFLICFRVLYKQLEMSKAIETAKLQWIVLLNLRIILIRSN